jgi:hypothetical protein
MLSERSMIELCALQTISLPRKTFRRRQVNKRAMRRKFWQHAHRHRLQDTPTTQRAQSVVDNDARVHVLLSAGAWGRLDYHWLQRSR